MTNFLFTAVLCRQETKYLDKVRTLPVPILLGTQVLYSHTQFEVAQIFKKWYKIPQFQLYVTFYIFLKKRYFLTQDTAPTNFPLTKDISKKYIFNFLMTFLNYKSSERHHGNKHFVIF